MKTRHTLAVLASAASFGCLVGHVSKVGLTEHGPVLAAIICNLAVIYLLLSGRKAEGK